MNKYTQKEIRVVQRLIERCLTYYLTREEAISTLYNYEPQFVRLVWQKLEEQNPDFFKAYSIRLALKKQIVMFNELISQQAASMKPPVTSNNTTSPFHGQTQGTSVLNQQGFGIEQPSMIQQQQTFSQQAPNQYNPQQFPNQYGQQNIFINQNQQFGTNTTNNQIPQSPSGDGPSLKQTQQTPWDPKNMWSQQTPNTFTPMTPFSPTSMLNPIPQSPSSIGNNMNMYSQQRNNFNTFGSQESQSLDQFNSNTSGQNQQNRYLQMFQAQQNRSISVNQGQNLQNTMNQPQKETEDIESLPTRKAKVKSLTVNTSKKRKKTSINPLETPNLITPTGLTPHLTTPTSLPTPLTLSTPQETSSQLRHDFIVTPTTPTTSGQTNGNNIFSRLDPNQLNALSQDGTTDLLNDSKQFYDDFAGVGMLGNQSNENNSNDGGALFD